MSSSQNTVHQLLEHLSSHPPSYHEVETSKRITECVINRPIKQKQIRPPRPLTSSMLYFKEHKDGLINAGYTMKDVRSALTTSWRDLSDEEKQPYILSAATLKEAYNMELDKLDNLDKFGPKRPKTSYQLYSDTRRAGLINDGYTTKDVSLMIAKSWFQLSDEEKEPYEISAASLKKTYNIELEKWEKEYTP
tara:strand:+ start:3978 stop:4553 length:576 start_codon:yes stop_codon:yes gene_type:complete